VEGFSLEEMDKASGAIEFDTAVSLKTTEFKTIKEFYDARSSGFVVKDIAIPSLFINAKDDPFVDADYFPWKEMKENEHLFGVMTERGGHLGFMDGFGLGLTLSERTWDERLAATWMQFMVKRLNNTQPNRIRLKKK
jgi:predicted alpha/beta-fold hydrolase